ncbi:MAG: hypothetical protein VW729_17920 [Deltaproteobacteria bacterium]
MRSLLNGFLFVGIVISVLAESAIALESPSKINAEILLRQYFRNEVVIYSSQVENRCGRIGLNSKAVDQILVEEIDAAELLAMNTESALQLPRLFLSTEVQCLAQYLGKSVVYHYSVALKWQDQSGKDGQLILGTLANGMGFGDELRKPLGAIRQAARGKIKDLLEAHRRTAQ